MMNLVPRASVVVLSNGGRRLPSLVSAIVVGDGLSRWNNSDGVGWDRRRQQQHQHPPSHYVKNLRYFSSTMTASSQPSTTISNRSDILPRRTRLQIGLQGAATATGTATGGGGGDGDPTRITSVLSTAIRNGIRLFDIPPSFEEYAQTSSSSASAPSSSVDVNVVAGNVGSTCYHANRKSERQVVTACQSMLESLFYDRGMKKKEHNASEEENEDGIVTLTSRLGYRSAISISPETKHATAPIIDMDDNYTNLDIQEQEGAFIDDAQVGILFAGRGGQGSNNEYHDLPSSSTATTDHPSAVAIVHNLSSEYVLHSLRTSPLVQWRHHSSSSLTGEYKIRLISLAHNPETQMAAYLIQQQQQQQQLGANSNHSALLTEARSYMKQALTSSFIGYELAIKEDLIDGYGIDSNGLSLPLHHNMHICWKDVLECAVDAYVQVHGDRNLGGNSGAEDDDGAVDSATTTMQRSSLKMIRLPGNLLETRGLDVAETIRTFFTTNNHDVNIDGDVADGATDSHSQESSRILRKLHQYRHILPTSVDVYITRPTTAYPHGGGSNNTNNIGAHDAYDVNGKNVDAKHPVLIQDYQIITDVEESSSASSSESTTTNPTKSMMMWTNEYYNAYGLRPTTYQSVLNATLSHFDADSILEASQSRKLTVEERETLDGCKLLRDMIHDLDVSVDDMKSFAAYEEYLMNVAVPLIYGSFEGLDEESASRLQEFLRVHGMTARLVVARWTREMLLAGWRSRRRVNGEKEAGDDDDIDWEKNPDEEKKIWQVWKSLGFGNDTNSDRGQLLGYKIPEDTPLQEFAVRHLLENTALGGVVLDCSSPEHVLEATRAADSTRLA
jgi:hypothetical protein